MFDPFTTRWDGTASDFCDCVDRAGLRSVSVPLDEAVIHPFACDFMRALPAQKRVASNCGKSALDPSSVSCRVDDLFEAAHEPSFFDYAETVLQSKNARLVAGDRSAMTHY